MTEHGATPAAEATSASTPKRTRDSIGSTSSSNPFPTADSTPNFLDDNGSSYSTHTLHTLHKGRSGAEGPVGDGGSIGSDDSIDGQPAIIHVRQPGDDSDDEDGHSGRTSQMEAAESRATSVERRRIVVRAVAQLAILFVVCAAVMGGTLYFALPKIDAEDRDAFRIPKNFDQLKALNAVLQKYKDENYGRVMLCWIVVYMFLQAFSIPGSMYMSILAGAMWGVPVALPIVCASVATGATICYLISKFLGEVLHAIPSWKARVDSWKAVLDRQRDDMLSYLIVIRMMPVPPHNVVNILAPHLGIGIPLFWFSTFCGIFAVSVIHTTIGEKLDQMASPADFNLFTWRNALLLGGVCVAVLVPVALRKRSAAASNPLEEGETPTVGRLRLDGEEGHLGSGNGGGRSLVGRSRPGVGQADNGHEYGDDEDELPPVRMRGAIAGFSRRGEEDYYGEADAADSNSDDDQSRAWGRDHHKSATWNGNGGRASFDDGSSDAASLRGFRDRDEQQGPRSYRPVSSRSKAARMLGLSGGGGGGGSSSNHGDAQTRGPGGVQRHRAAGNGTATVVASSGAGPSIADSVTGGLGSLWTKVTGAGNGAPPNGNGGRPQL